MSPRRIALPALEYDEHQQQLYITGQRGRQVIALRRKSHALLTFMVKRNADSGGKAILFSHAELLNAAWPGDSRRTHEELAHLVWEIRKKLAPFGADSLLINERGRGYRLQTIDLEPAQTPSDPANRRHRLQSPLQAAALALGLAAAGAAIGIFLATAGRGPARVSAAVNERVAQFPLPFAGSRPAYITTDRDGTAWFTEYDGNKIGRLTLTGALTEFPIPTPNSGPEGIALGPDRNMWFAESNGNKVGFITPSGSIVQFPLPHANSGPESVVADDGAVWFTEDAHRIGRITHAGAITEFALPASVVPSDITLGADHNLWFDSPYTGPGDALPDQRVGRITPDGRLTIFNLPTRGSAPGAIAAVGGDIWVAEVEAGKLARITPSGVATEFPLEDAKARPADVTSGPGGGVWFTEKAANAIGHLESDGHITQTPLPTPNSGPHGIAAGRNGTIWFTEIEAGKIGLLRPEPRK